MTGDKSGIERFRKAVARSQKEREDAIEWLKEHENDGFLGHGSADRHDIMVARMKKIAGVE